MRRQTGKKIGWSIFIAGVFFFSAFDLQAALDAPHNTSRSVSCLSCHQMPSSYPMQLPPLNNLPADIDDTVTNGLCWSCQ